MRTIQIGNRKVGPNEPAYLIAEVGYNFENDFEIARRMTIEAARSGADAVKFQTFQAARLVTRSAPKFWDVEGLPGNTQYEEFLECEPLTREQYRELSELAVQHGAVMFSTAFDEDCADLLEEVGVPAYKIASMDLTHLPLLTHVAHKNKPIILSTGAGTIEEIQEAVDTITAQGNHDLVLLHCITNYPCKDKNAHLRMMVDMQQRFSPFPVGYSDHTIPDACSTVPLAAATMGARVIEKHFTLDKTRVGWDHPLSGDPTAFHHMSDAFRIIHEAMGLHHKAPAPSEDRAVLYARRSLVAWKHIAKGQRITAADLIVLRPSTGIKPKHFEQVLGRIATEDIPENTVLQWEMLKEGQNACM